MINKATTVARHIAARNLTRKSITYIHSWEQEKDDDAMQRLGTTWGEMLNYCLTNYSWRCLSPRKQMFECCQMLGSQL